MAIKLEEFEEIEQAIKSINEQESENVQLLRNQMLEILTSFIPYLNICFKYVQSIKVFELDDYFFKTNYEDCSPIQFYLTFKIDKSNVNINFLLKNKKKRISKKQQLLNQIIVQQQQEVPLLDDITNIVFKEISQCISSQDKIFAKDGVVRVCINNKHIIEIIIGYEFEQNLITYHKNALWFRTNIENVISNFNAKNEQTNKEFSKMCQLFKALEKELIYAEISSIYISKKSNLAENLLYNVPNEFFIGNKQDVFLKIVNYLINANFDNFVLMDRNNPMFDKNTIYNIEEAKNYCKKIMYVFNNYKDIIEITSDNNNQSGNLQQKENNMTEIVNNKKTIKLGKTDNFNS